MEFNMGKHEDGVSSIKKGLKKYENTTMLKAIEIEDDPKKDLENYMGKAVSKMEDVSKSIAKGLGTTDAKMGGLKVKAVVAGKVKPLKSMKFRKRK
jgi:hypothetical protein